MRTFITLTVCHAIVCLGQPQGNGSGQYWRQEVHYQIEAFLDTTTHSLHGELTLTYKNHSPDTLKRMYLQVPANAFLDEENTAVKEMQRFRGGTVEVREREGLPLTIQSLQFQVFAGDAEAPVQAFDFHDTILDLPLPRPLVPGDSLVLNLIYTQNYKSAFAQPDSQTRSRRRGTPSPRIAQDLQIDFVDWYPRVAVYDLKGWHVEPFHFLMRSQSVFSEFADLEVTLTVPGNFVIVASGAVSQGDPGWNLIRGDSAASASAQSPNPDSASTTPRQLEPRRVHFRAQRAQNFIWSASPKFARRTVRALDQEINVFYPEAKQQQWGRNIVRETDRVLRYLHDYIGEYPYPQLNIVAAAGRQTAQPSMLLLEDEDTFSLVYALARLYFPGIVGSNGVREGWMADGLAFYFAKHFAEQRHGKLGYDADSARKDLGVFAKFYPLPSIDNLLRDFTRMYMNSGQNEPIANAVHQYKDPVGMFANSFMKAELLYEMLRYVVGDSAFKNILQRYYREWAFKHAGEEAFIAICEETSGQELDWFFNQWLHATPTVDYQKSGTVQRQREDGSWVTEVEIKRKGDGIMPVEVELKQGDGSTLVQRWDGKDATGKLVFETAEKPKSVAVDPNDQIMDNNLLNNGRRRLIFKPDLPFMRFVYMPGDAYLVRWRPNVGYNRQDGLRLGLRTQTSYRAFYHNLTLQADYGFLSHEIDGTVAYNHPWQQKNVGNRYGLLARKVEGRFEADAHLQIQAASGLISESGTKWQVGVNYSRLLDGDYTYRELASDTGTVRLEEWEEATMTFAYVAARGHFGRESFGGETKWRAEIALPQSHRRFSKIAGYAQGHYRRFGLESRVRLNAATSFGPDALPLQDIFHGEGADARTRFRNDKVKTGGDWLAFKHRLVEGGGNLRGYTGTPLLVEKFATFNLELGPTHTFIGGLKLFGFYDRGLLWQTRHSSSFWRANAGAALSFGDSQARLFGSEVLANLSFRVYFPFWVSHPLPGERKEQMRWYVALGKSL
ncbi:MAG: M1 family metallopeptidase [bacterium]